MHDMNLPNKLTVARMALIPFFLVFMLVEAIPHRYLAALVIFSAASFTDYLDGKIARRDGLVTNFGKLMDPLADKLLVVAALVCFMQVHMITLVAFYIIIAREFLVTSVRLIAVEKGVVIAADIWGKLKTVLQMVWIVFVLLLLWLTSQSILPQAPGAMLLRFSAWFQWVIAAVTVFSGVNYVAKNRTLFAEL